MNHWKYICLLQFVFLSSLAGPVGAESKLHDIEYRIISTALNHGAGKDIGIIIIDGRTTGASVDINTPDQNQAELAKELGTTAFAIREWSRINRRRHILQQQLVTNGEYSLLAKDTLSSIFNNDDPAINWQRFRRRFPNSQGLVRVSRPGIDDTPGGALLYMEFECGVDCGSGRLVNLTRNGDQWSVTSATLLWITTPE